MSLVPARHIHPASFRDTLNTSLSRLHFTIPSQLFFRYSFSHSALSKHSLSGGRRSYSTCSGTVRNSNSEREYRHRVIKCSSSRETPSTSYLSGQDWLDKWNQPRQQNRPKPVRPVMSYRNAGGSSARSRRIDPGGGGGGGGGGSTMEKIVEKLRNFGYMDEESDREDESERRIEKGSIEDIFYVEEETFPNARGGVSKMSPLGLDNEYDDDGEARFPWEERGSLEEEVAKNSVRKQSRTSVAELTLPESELRRLRHLTIRTKRKVKIGGAGVTKAIADTIHERWKDSEIVRLKVEGAPALNMRRIHEILERKTGGLVIWRSGTSVSLYRGVSYKDPSVHVKKQILKQSQDSHGPSRGTIGNIVDRSEISSPASMHSAEKSLVRKTDDAVDSQSLQEVVYENEVDRLLADLGPRYTDWPGGDPLPVDADMLPGVVAGYEPPFRLLPYGVRATIAMKEATALRRIARTLPPHFAIGRSRQLEGLAMAMVKLWEKSSIAKIALKRGVQVTTSERMAESMKKLTGGTLVSRNKDYIVLYRGKDFLSPAVSEALLERERLAKALQDEEEKARLNSPALFFTPSEGTIENRVGAGTLEETLDADARWGKKLNEHDKENALREAEVLRHSDLVRKLERKLTLAEKKLVKAESALEKVEQWLKPADRQADPDSISDEERYMYRKLGLKMKAFLLLGRRGVFGGTIENMHLHWKYRELVKIIVKAPSFEEVKNIALSLESESGGVLVSVDKVSKGYAIVVFHGKDYNRPPTLRPKNLLTKRRALARSIELQRREALLKHIASVQKNVGKLRSEIDEVEAMNGRGDAEYYDDLDSAYPTEDDDSEEEGDDTYFDDGNDEEDEGGSDSVQVNRSQEHLVSQYDDAESEPEEHYEMSEVGSSGGESDIDSDEEFSDRLDWDARKMERLDADV